ncbi:MAG: ribosomal-protein-alanine N-acetyltransferase [Algoriphagus sp.]
MGIPENIKETEDVIKPWIHESERSNVQNYTFAIQVTIDKKLVGLIAIRQKEIKHKRAEVWFKINPDHWGKGIASEALERMLEYGFSKLKLHCIEAGCDVGNIGSIKALERVGMTREERKRKILPLKSGWSDDFMCANLEEYFKL